MKKLAITQFKSHALRLLEEVSSSKESILILKRGKPLAKVIPFTPHEKPMLGRLAGTLSYEGDIVEPLGEEMWESAQ